MFPEITRDEVFRIETPRLWLRWPGLADASTLAAVMAKECREAGSRLALANVQALEPIIMHWRQDMEAGRAFHLALVPKTGARLPVGMVHASTTQGLRLSPDSSLAQLGAEAVRSLEAMMALLGIEAPPQPRLDPRPMLHGGATHPGPPFASDNSARAAGASPEGEAPFGPESSGLSPGRSIRSQIVRRFCPDR